MEKDRIKIEKGSGNIYKDLGYANPEEMQAKAHLVFKIDDVITERKLSLDEASEILNISKSELSDILDGLFRSVSIERLLSLHGKLDPDIEIVHHKRLTDTPSVDRRTTTSAD